jgi:hypothetical protein
MLFRSESLSHLRLRRCFDLIEGKVGGIAAKPYGILSEKLSFSAHRAARAAFRIQFI